MYIYISSPKTRSVFINKCNINGVFVRIFKSISFY